MVFQLVLRSDFFHSPLIYDYISRINKFLRLLCWTQWFQSSLKYTLQRKLILDSIESYRYTIRRYKTSFVLCLLSFAILRNNEVETNHITTLPIFVLFINQIFRENKMIVLWTSCKCCVAIWYITTNKCKKIFYGIAWFKLLRVE